MFAHITRKFVPLLLSALLTVSLTACDPGEAEPVSSLEETPSSQEVSSAPVSSAPVSAEASSDPASSEEASSEAPSSQEASSETVSSAPPASSTPPASSEVPAAVKEAPVSSKEPAPSSQVQQAPSSDPPASSEAPAPSSEPEPASSEEAVPQVEILSNCGGEEGEMERLLFDKINDKRAELGLSRLQWSGAYHTAANIRCKELPYLYEHVRPDGQPWYTVLTEVGLPSYPGRENLVYGQDAAFSDMEAVVDALYEGWINSPDHYENITATDVNAAGLCVIYNGSDVYAAQEFGKV